MSECLCLQRGQDALAGLNGPKILLWPCQWLLPETQMLLGKLSGVPPSVSPVHDSPWQPVLAVPRGSSNCDKPTLVHLRCIVCSRPSA